LDEAGKLVCRELPTKSDHFQEPVFLGVRRIQNQSHLLPVVTYVSLYLGKKRRLPANKKSREFLLSKVFLPMSEKLTGKS
jgi:hypothetical protein